MPLRPSRRPMRSGCRRPRSAPAARWASPATRAARAAVPSAGVTLVAPAPLSSSDLLDAVDRRSGAASCSRRRRLGRTSAASPVATSYATSCPAAATMTRSSTTSGELEKPQSGISRRCRPRRCATTRRRRSGVERVQDAGGAERVDASVAERRRPARTGAGIRLPEPRRVAMSSTPARRSPGRSRRRPRRRRAAPACR